MAAPLYITDSGLYWHAGKIVVVAVGLPARGKTHLSRALERYLRWLGIKTQVVSLGDNRRKLLGGAKNLPPDYFSFGLSTVSCCIALVINAFQGEKSDETIGLRQKVAISCENMIWDWFENGGQVVIYDANNGTKEQRHVLAEKFDKAGIHVILLGQSSSILSPSHN
jgi:6-phosphofructo-2-kinase / fructose-2,6-biphosphatase 4